jgi:hypothetical protein
MTVRSTAPSMVPVRRRTLAEPGRAPVRALIAMTLLTGALGAPRPGSSQGPADSPYPQATADAREEVRRFLGR